MPEILKWLKNFTKAMLSFSFKYFEDDELPTLFATLKRTFDAADVPFYLIGARARDVWFFPEKSMRITQDIDWIAASDEDTVFNEIKNQLIEKEGFIETKNPFTLLNSKGIQVDLLPFIESAGSSLEGLKEVFARGTEGVIFDDDATYQVATLPAIVLLKLIAWDDRPEHRPKDLWDIEAIFEHYFDRFSEDIYDNHNDLFGGRELGEISAFVIGRKIKHIIGDSTSLKTRIENILTEKHDAIAQRIADKSSKPEDEVSKILKNLFEGILE
jgi:predicted nucleotidyltransferase